MVKIIAWWEIRLHWSVTRGEIWVKSNVDYVNNKCQWIWTVTTRHQRHVMELQAWDLLHTYRKTTLSHFGSMMGQHRERWTNIKPTVIQRLLFFLLIHVPWSIIWPLFFKIFSMSMNVAHFILLYRPFVFERVYLPLFKVADTPFHHLRPIYSSGFNNFYSYLIQCDIYLIVYMMVHIAAVICFSFYLWSQLEVANNYDNYVQCSECCKYT